MRALEDADNLVRHYQRLAEVGLGITERLKWRLTADVYQNVVSFLLQIWGRIVRKMPLNSVFASSFDRSSSAGYSKTR